MQEIELIGIDEKIYYYKTKSGLKVYMWVNDRVRSMESCLCVKYGSIHTKFKVGRKIYEVPNGVAHFLEHIKFNISDDVTAHDVFYKLGADSNAFTTFEYTNYYTFTTENKCEVINELLNFVYNPFFTKKMVEKEKGIIVEEARMGIDDVNSLMYFTSLQNVLVKSKFRNFITGTVDDVNKISVDDVKLVYDTFYHPENMFMVVTGNFNPYEVANVVEENLSKKDFLEYKNPYVIMESEPRKVNKKYYEDNINVGNTNIVMIAKMDMKRFKDFSLNKLNYLLNIIFELNFGVTSDFKEKMINDGVATSFGFSSNNFGDDLLIMLSGSVNFKDEYINRIKDKLSNLVVSEKDFLRKKNALIATYILNFEEIDNVSMRLQDNLINDGYIVEDEKIKLENLSMDDINKILELLDFSNMSINIYNKKNNQE